MDSVRAGFSNFLDPLASHCTLRDPSSIITVQSPLVGG
jgi:hypothetical protein